jgi:hypothetical protein
MKRLSLLALTTLLVFKLSAQTGIDSDSINTDSLIIESQFSMPAAWVYLDHVVSTNSVWRSQEDPLRAALQRLLDHSREPFDSTRSRLLEEDLSLVEVHLADPIVTGSNELKWLNDSTFLVDSHGWSSGLYLEEESNLIYPEPSKQTPFLTLVDSTELSDTLTVVPDTVYITLIDTAAIEALGIAMHSYRDSVITPSLDKEGMIGVMTSDRSRDGVITLSL